MNIDILINAIRNSRVRITNHADEEAANDNLAFEEIYFSVIHGNIIESYLDDFPYPSCLVMGNTFSGDPIHSVWAYNPSNEWAVLVTVYRPDPSRWVNWKERRKP